MKDAGRKNHKAINFSKENWMARCAQCGRILGTLDNQGMKEMSLCTECATGSLACDYCGKPLAQLDFVNSEGIKVCKKCRENISEESLRELDLNKLSSPTGNGYIAFRDALQRINKFPLRALIVFLPLAALVLAYVIPDVQRLPFLLIFPVGLFGIVSRDGFNGAGLFVGWPLYILLIICLLRTKRLGRFITLLAALALLLLINFVGCQSLDSHMGAR
jgi:hypothetical protein